MSSQVPGTNVPPISFPGISSGIDYNSIINKLTSLTLSQNVTLNQQIATLNAANAELIKINNLFESVQNALGALSNPDLFNAYSATSSNSSVLTAQGITGQVATPGTYTIDSVTTATATSVTSSATAGHSIRDNITQGPYAGLPSDGSGGNVPLIDSYAAVTPSNGSGSAGTVTVDGIQVSYNVNTDSLTAILNRIQTAVRTYDPSFTIGYNGATDQIVVNGSKPITLGSANDQGNLIQVLKLDQAQINNSGPGPYQVLGTSGVGGINQAAALNGNTYAGFKGTGVSSGFFTINGVAITVDSTGDNVASILAKINASSAGVTASYNYANNQITLTSKTTGAQSIVVGASGDTSNFLSEAGLTTASGATTSLGQQAKIVLQNPNGSTSTIYSNSNQVTAAIPGMQLNLLSNTATPFTVSVSQDSSNLVSAVNSFISAYNSTVTEIGNATQPPVVTGTAPGSSATNSQAVGAGILWGNSDVTSIKDTLTALVSGFFGSGSSYNSLASIGLSLSDSFSTYTTSNNGTTGNGGTVQSGQTGQAIQSTTYQGTDGTFQALNTSTFSAALAANASAVQAIFQGSSGLTTQLGTYLTGVTGAPTLLNAGSVGTIPTVSIVQAFENTNTANITSIQEQVQQITDSANLQADGLRAEFVQTESQLAGYQGLQSQLAGFFKSSGG